MMDGPVQPVSRRAPGPPGAGEIGPTGWGKAPPRAAASAYTARIRDGPRRMQIARRTPRVVQNPADAIVISRTLVGIPRMSDRPASAESTPPPTPASEAGSGRRGLEDRLALGLVLPLAAGALVAAFLPWTEWRWIAFAVVGLAVAFVTWLWLRRTIVLPLRGLVGALESGRLANARDVPPVPHAGEVTALHDATLSILQRHRRLERDLEELAALRACVASLAASVAAWNEGEERPAIGPRRDGAEGVPEAARPLVEGLGLALERLDARGAEARTVAGLVRDTMDDARQRGEAVMGGAERQFVEATSLLTVLRELRRWAGELAPALDALRAAASARLGEDGAGGARWQHLLDEAIEGGTRPLTATERAAQRLATSAEDMLFLAESARLTRIEAAAAALAGTPEAAGFVDALETFSRDTAALRERMLAHERATFDELAGAREELVGLHARLRDAARDLAVVTQHPGLAGAPVVPRGVDPAVGARRSLERVHEMVAEALARGEKLVQQAERTSSEALRAGDGVRVALDELDGFRARLEPARPVVAAADGDASPAGDDEPGEGEAGDDEADDASPPMRVLGPADVLDDDGEVGFRG